MSPLFRFLLLSLGLDVKLKILSFSFIQQAVICFAFIVLIIAETM